MDKIALNHKAALRYAFNVGVLNELNCQQIYDRMKAEIKEPTQGYFYADDVDTFCASLIAEMLEAVK